MKGLMKGDKDGKKKNRGSNNTPTQPTISYFELEENPKHLNDIWCSIIERLNEREFWEHLNLFVTAFDKDATIWTGFHHLQSCYQYDFRSETYPEITQDQATLFVSKFDYITREFEEQNTLEILSNLTDISFVIYMLTLLTSNAKVFIESNMSISIVSLSLHMVSLKEFTNEIYLVLFYLFKILSNMANITTTDMIMTVHEDTLLTLFSKSIKMLKPIEFTRKEYILTISMLDAMAKCLRKRSLSLKLKDIKVLDHLLIFVGWPEDVTPIWTFEDTECKYRLQLSVMHVLSSTFQVKANIQRWAALGGFLRIQDFIFWTSNTFSVKEAPIELISQQIIFPLEPPSWKTIIKPGCWIICNYSLKHVFDTLMTMCINSLTSTKLAGGTMRTKKSPTFLINTIVSVVLNLFDDNVRNTEKNNASRQFIVDYPELQLYVLSFLSSLLEQFSMSETELAVPFWEIVRKEKYFLPVPHHGDLVDTETDVMKQNVSSYLKAIIVGYTFQYLEYVITTQPNNNSDVDFIFTLLQSYYESGYYKHLCRATASLLLISTFSSELATDRAIHFGLTDILRLIIAITEKMASEKNSEVLEYLNLSRIHLYKSVQIFACTRIGSKYILRDYTTYEEIFYLLTDCDVDITKSFALPLLIRQMSSYEPSEPVENYSRLFVKYTDTIVKSHRTLQNTTLTSLLLEGIIHTLIEDRAYEGGSRELYHMKVKEKQKIYNESECFEKIMIILEEGNNIDDELRSYLCNTVLKVITALMKNNSQMKESFKSRIGYQRLEKALLRFNMFKLSQNNGLIIELVRMMLDGKYHISINASDSGKSLEISSHFFDSQSSSLSPNISNPSITSLLLKLIPYFENGEKTIIFRCLNNLVRSSSVNVTKLCTEGVLGQCLDMINVNFSELNELFEFISTLSGYNITVKELGKVLRLFDPFDGDVRPKWTANLLSSLDHMVEHGTGPRYYFDFDGLQSALVIPTMPRWPPDGKGVTMCTRIRVESFLHPSTHLHYEPRIFSFTNDAGVGCELFFIESYLHFRVLLPQKKSETKRFNIPFQEKEWYTICLIFSLNGRLLGRSADVRLFVKSDLNLEVCKESFNRCILFQNVNHCYIGTASDVISSDPPPTFYGQMGEIIFFDDETSHERLKEVLVEAHTALGEWSNVFGSIPSLVMNYSPMTIDMNVSVSETKNTLSICYDLSKHARDSKIIDGLDVVHRRHARHLFACLSGGIQVIFPLLLLLDKHKSLSHKEVLGKVLEDGASSEVFSIRDKQLKRSLSRNKKTLPVIIKDITSQFDSGDSVFLEQITQIMMKILLSSKELQDQMVQTKGFAVFAFLLLRLSPNNLSKNFLAILLDVLDKEYLNPTLKTDIIEFLFLDFHLWVYASFDVQKLLLTKVLPYIISAMPNGKNVVTVKHLLQIIRTYYWTVSTPDVMATDVIVHPITKHVVSQRPHLEELCHLRGYIILIINELIGRNITFEDSKAIVHFITDCKDPVLCEEMLLKARAILENPLLRKDFLDHIIIIGYEVLLHPLKSKSNTIRSHCIYFICILNSYLVPLKEEFPFAALYDYLKPHIPDKRIYQVLLNASIGSYSKKDSSEKLCLDENSFIRNPYVIPVTLRLAYEDPNKEYRIQFLKDFKMLIEFKNSSKKALLSLPFWEMYILSFITDSEDIDKKYYKSISDIATDIFIAIALYKLKEEKFSVEFFYNLLCWYQVAALEKNLSSLDDMFMAFLRGIVETLHYELKLYSMKEMKSLDILNDIDKKDSPIFGNMIHLIIFITDFVILSSKSIGDAFIASPLVRNSKIEGLVLEMMNWIECTSSFNTQIEQSALSSSTFKKGVFRGVNSIPLVMKIAFLQIYTSRNVDVLKKCIEYLEKRITKRGAKKDEAYYVAFHLLNALSFSVTFLSQEKALPEEKEWVEYQVKFTLPLLGKLFKLFKAQFAELKRLDNEQLEYLQELTNASSPEILFSQHRFMESFLAVLRLRLSDLHRLEVESVNLDKVIKKNSKSLHQKFKSHRAFENELGVKTIETIDWICYYFFSNERIISNNILKDYYFKVGRSWRNIVRTLRSERGPWGNVQAITHWKLDKIENNMRMRLRMKQNHNFNEHKDALKVMSSQDRDLILNMINMDINNIDVTSMDMESGRPDSKVDSGDNQEELEQTQTERDREKMIFMVDCELIQPMLVTTGVLEITANFLHFREVRDSDREYTDALKEKSWSIDKIREIHSRRYLLRHTALEFFFVDSTNYFFNFKRQDRRKVYYKIKGLNPPNLIKELTKEEALWKWQKRKISNFEYLMHLNTLAGRTYNDLTQYPVFPWILSDYESETIDLKDPSVYRDLSKPVGALNPDRLQGFVERFNSMPSSKAFHYGSHYSCAASVLYYLVRMEPFTTWFIKLHDNSFDHADRMFFSLPQTYQNCLISTGDVKELIPEFFYCSEMFENSNKFDFGTRQNGKKIGDVELPPWAKTPEEFIRIHQQALESEYVSQNLPKWIDLIFGWNQRGRRAIEHFNLFHYLTYEGMVDIDQITDPVQREAAITMIMEFGQTPAQLFTEQHPSRDELVKPEVLHPLQPKAIPVSTESILWTASDFKKGNVVCLDKNGHLHVFNKDVALLERDFSSPKVRGDSSTVQEEKSRLLLPHLVHQKEAFALSNDGQVVIAPRLEVSGIKTLFVDTKRQHQSISSHNDLVTALGFTEDGSLLITGSRDTTLLVWKIESRNNIPWIVEQPIATLNGHDDTIAHVCVSIHLKICVSTSKDHACLVHCLKDFRYIRSITHTPDRSIDQIAISSQGYIIFFSKPSELTVYTINAKRVCHTDAPEVPTCMVVSEDGEYLITGGKDSIIIRQIYDLKVTRRIYIDGNVTSLGIDEKHLIAGLEDGRVHIVGQNFCIN